MTEDEYEQFRQEAMDSLVDLNADCERQFSIGHWERWDYDAHTGTIAFSEAGAPKVIADVQVVGTTSTKSRNWLWAWSNQSVPSPRSALIEKVREFGEAESLSSLTEAYLSDGEHLGWELTAITVKLINGRGGYRTPRPQEVSPTMC